MNVADTEIFNNQINFKKLDFTEKWILSKQNKAIEAVRNAIENYKLGFHLF